MIAIPELIGVAFLLAAGRLLRQAQSTETNRSKRPGKARIAETSDTDPRDHESDTSTERGYR